MSAQYPNTPNLAFDFTPAMKQFMENVEIWKQNYEQLVKNSSFTHAAVAPPDLISKPVEQAVDKWKTAGETLFRSFIEQQAELCRFFGRRWETYLDYSRRLSNCKAPSEVAELEMEFLKRMATDYSEESAKLARPFNDLMAIWTAGRFT